MSNRVIRAERGWAGHYILAYRCRFRRNTLLQCGAVGVVVSTVGDCVSQDETIEVSAGRWYETMAFMAKHYAGYVDADVSRQVHFCSKWALGRPEWAKTGIPNAADAEANRMHEAVVEEIAAKLADGTLEIPRQDLLMAEVPM